VAPDLFALANVVLERAEAFRFALSPVGEWLPARIPDWARAVEETGREWSVWVKDPSAADRYRRRACRCADSGVAEFPTSRLMR
jgi:hypothetical protein